MAKKFLIRRFCAMGTLQVVTLSVTVVLMINVVLAGIMVFFERRKPASTWAWLLVLFFIPGFGFLIYIFFGRDSKRERVFEAKGRYDREVYYNYIYKSKYWDKMKEQTMCIKKRKDLIGYEYLNDLAYLHINSGHWVTFNNKVESFIDGKEKFDSLIKDIRAARKYIHMEYYILRSDELGKTIVEELAKKALEGVEVRLLYDGMGCRVIKKGFFKQLVKNGGRVAVFLPPLIARINYRDHRKICIIDGQIGYIGGFNIGNEYLGIVKRYGAWRDTHLKIMGDAIDQLQIRFIMDWNFASHHHIALENSYFPNRMQSHDVCMQIVSSGPDTKWNNILNGYFKMMNEAEDHIYVETPYFVPDDGILEALRTAALSGIDVRIIIPANPDHFFVYWASMSYLGELLDAGVRCYQYEKGFIHSKAIFIDGKVSSIGTANMDIRSFELNFEINAFIYDEKTTKKLEKDFLQDLSFCTEITRDWYANRKWWFRLRESVSRLISPML